MKSLFLFLILAGCAAPNKEIPAENNQEGGNTKIIIKTPFGYGEAGSEAVKLAQTEKPWENLGGYIGTANTAEELFSKEELKNILNVCRSNQENLEKFTTPVKIILPPLWHRVKYINTNFEPFKNDFWNSTVWRSHYLEATKDYPQNLSPQEATAALFDREEITIYDLYYFGEMGADFNHTNSYEEDIKEAAKEGLDFRPNGPKYAVRSFLTQYIEPKEKLPVYDYLFSKGLSIDFFYGYRSGWFCPEAELLKYLVSKGLDINNIPDSWYEFSEPYGKKGDMLYQEAFIYASPFYAYLLLALGYTNEIAGFQMTSFKDNYWEQPMYNHLKPEY